MVVQHNLQAVNANRLLGMTTSAQSKSTEKLSSGYRINRAADDAAGLTISEKMRKQIRGLDRASTNAQDGVSAVQTAEGALTEVHDMLQRMNELATQAANGTNSQSDRESIQSEVDQLLTEIDRVAETTKFNEIYLLKGDPKNSNTKDTTLEAHDAGIKGNWTVDPDTAKGTLEVELKAGNIISVGGKSYKVKEEDTSNIGTNPYVSADGIETFGDEASEGTGNASHVTKEALLEAFDEATDASSVTIGSTEYEIVESFDKDALYPDTETEGDTISVDGKTYTYNDDTSKWINNDDADDKLNATGMKNAIGDAAKVVVVGETAQATRAGITEELGKLSDDADPAVTVLIDETPYSVGVEAVDDTNTGNKSNAAEEKSASDIVSSLNNGDVVTIGTGDAAKSITVADTTTVNAKVDAAVTAGAGSTVKIGDDTYVFTAAPDASGAGGYVTFNDENGDGSYWTADSGTTKLSDDELKTAISTAMTNGDTVSITPAGGTATTYGTTAAVETALEAAGDNATVSVTGSDGTTVNYTLKSSPKVTDSTPELAGVEEKSAADIVKEIKKALDAANKIGTDNYTEVEDPAQSGDKYTFTVTPGTVAHQKALSFNLHVGADADMNNKINVNIETMNSKYLGIQSLDVVGKDSDGNLINDGGIQATYAIDAIADALAKVSEQRSTLGAVQNRLEHTISNLDNVVENTTSAESRIRDTDMAKEMVNYSKNNILAQAGQSMLAQANQSNQGVLSLLG